MLTIAFTLGFVGSLHCVGMCGPLAIAFCNREGASKANHFFSGLSYNLGRTTTYSLLGLIMGLIGSFFFFTSLQKLVSIFIGIILVAAFIFQLNMGKSIQLSWLNSLYDKAKFFISSLLSKAKEYHPYTLGLANGILPCGLVYLALAGAISSEGILSSVLFMTFFGLGTIPMLLTLTFGSSMFPLKVKSFFKPILPFTGLLFGLFLIYRGIVIETPTELNFWLALKNPIMCH